MKQTIPLNRLQKRKMQSKNIIFSSLKESFAQILRNKPFFVLLFISQIIFLIIFFFINYSYQTKILESAQAISGYISQQKLDDISVSQNILQQKNILGDDPLLVSRNFNEIVKNFRLYLIYTFLLLIIFISINWSLTYKLVHKQDFNHLLKILLKIISVSLFYLGLIFSFFYSILNVTFTQIAFESAKIFTKYIPYLILSLILAYFMFVSLSLLQKTELKNIVQKTLVIGIKKIHYILSVYFINIFLFVASIYLFYSFIEKNLFILFMSIILMLFSFVFGRIFMVKVVEKLD